METERINESRPADCGNCFEVCGVNGCLDEPESPEYLDGWVREEKENQHSPSNGLFSKDGTVVHRRDLTPAEAAALIVANKGNNDLIILDVSTKKEYLKWHLENAINLNFISLKFRDKLNSLNKDKSYIVYCKKGGRSKLAQTMMKHLGFNKVYNIAGGRDRWQAEELPLGRGMAGSSKWSLCPISLSAALYRKLKSALAHHQQQH